MTRPALANLPTYVHLQWCGPFALDALPEQGGAQGAGLYQVYGDHPVFGQNVLLYIGRSDGAVATRVTREQWELEDVRAEIQVGLLYDEPAGLSAEARTQRLAMAERLLIMAHKPPYCAREIVHRPAPSGQRVHVVNWGVRRSLLPEVSEAFWSSEFDHLTVPTSGRPASRRT